MFRFRIEGARFLISGRHSAARYKLLFGRVAPLRSLVLARLFCGRFWRRATGWLSLTSTSSGAGRSQTLRTQRARRKHEQHCRQRKTSRQTANNERSHFESVSESSAQTEIKIRRRCDRAETTDYLPQLRLLSLKLTTSRTLAQVLRPQTCCTPLQHQLIEFPTNHFTIVFSHNFFTYK